MENHRKFVFLFNFNWTFTQFFFFFIANYSKIWIFRENRAKIASQVVQFFSFKIPPRNFPSFFTLSCIPKILQSYVEGACVALQARRTRSVGLRHSQWLHVTWVHQFRDELFIIGKKNVFQIDFWLIIFCFIQNGSACACGIRRSAVWGRGGRNLKIRQNGQFSGSQEPEKSTILAKSQTWSDGNWTCDSKYAQGTRLQIFLFIHSCFHFITLVGDLFHYN